MKKLPETDWAYLAGFVDGEGCIRATNHKNGRHYPRLRISQRDHLVLLELYELFGVGKFSLRKRREGVAAQWNTSTKAELRWVLENLLPYLRLKKTQAEVALRLMDNSKDHNSVVKLSDLKVHRQLESR